MCQSTFDEELLAARKELGAVDGDGVDGEGSARKACCQCSSKNGGKHVAIDARRSSYLRLRTERGRNGIQKDATPSRNAEQWDESRGARLKCSRSKSNAKAMLRNMLCGPGECGWRSIASVELSQSIART